MTPVMTFPIYVCEAVGDRRLQQTKWSAAALERHRVGYMPRQVFSFDPPERFIAGTVGEPGHRTFFLQARDASQLATVVVEKEQVALLAERLDALLDEVVRRTTGAVGGVAEAGVEDLQPLEQPIVEEFRVGTLTLAWDGADDRIVIEAFALAETGDDEGDAQVEDDVADQAVPPDEPDLLIVRLSATSARAFARRARAVVAAGRPPCPLCGLPLDPQGHVCPRQNGDRRRS
jgi:uncharacterized repeat protein (TIGR03847 family)